MTDLKILSCSNLKYLGIFCSSAACTGGLLYRVTFIKTRALVALSLLVGTLSSALFYAFSHMPRKQFREITPIPPIANNDQKIIVNPETVKEEINRPFPPKNELASTQLERIVHLHDYLSQPKPKNFQMAPLDKISLKEELQKTEKKLQSIEEIAQRILQIDNGNHFVVINGLDHIITKKFNDRVHRITVYVSTKKILGKGFEGEVKQFERINDGHLFACKILSNSSDERNDWNVQKDLRKELKKGQKLCGIIDKPKKINGNGQVGLLMPCFDGDLTKMPPKLWDRISIPTNFIAALLNLYRGLQSLHKQEFAHCDIKHENIFYKEKPNGELEFVLGDMGKILNFERYSSKYRDRTEEYDYVWTPEVHCQSDRLKILTTKDRVIKFYIFQDLDMISLAKALLLLLVSSKRKEHIPMRTELNKELLNGVLDSFSPEFQIFIHDLLFDRKYKRVEDVVNKLSCISQKK